MNLLMLSMDVSLYFTHVELRVNTVTRVSWQAFSLSLSWLGQGLWSFMQEKVLDCVFAL